VYHCNINFAEIYHDEMLDFDFHKSGNSEGSIYLRTPTVREVYTYVSPFVSCVKSKLFPHIVFWLPNRWFSPCKMHDRPSNANYQVAISWSRHVQPRTKHSDFREIVIKVTSVRGPRSRSHAVNAIYCFSLVNAGANGSHRTTCNRRRSSSN